MENYITLKMNEVQRNHIIFPNISKTTSIEINSKNT